MDNGKTTVLQEDRCHAHPFQYIPFLEKVCQNDAEGFLGY